jgi:hypothetical protein
MDLFEVYDEDGRPVSLDELPGSRMLRGEMAPEPMVVRNIVRETGEERWLLDRATPILDARGRIEMAVNLIEDITLGKRAELGSRLLAEASRQATEAGDLAGTLQSIADSAVPELADWAGIDLLTAEGSIRTVAVAHREHEKVRLGWHLRTTWPVDPGEPTGLPAVIRSGRAELIEEVTDEMLVQGARDEQHLATLRAVGLHSIMIVPLAAGDQVLGALSFVSSTARRFNESDLKLASDLGRQAGVVVRETELGEEQARIAHELQAGLLPPSLPETPGWRISSAYRAAGRLNEVGGDFYDVVVSSDGWSAIIGDVVGKGASAAALTALVRHTLATALLTTGDPAVALEAANRRLREHPARMLLCTIAIVHVDVDGGLDVFCAGHPLPLLRREGRVQPLGAGGSMLGMRDAIEIHAARVESLPGDVIVLYTDGVTDAVGARERFGEGRLRETIGGLDVEAPADVAERLRAAVERFSKGEQRDDIALLALVRTPEEGTPRAAAATTERELLA